MKRLRAAAALLLLAVALAGAAPAVSFHVVANSDDPADQAVKLRVRDALARRLLPALTAGSPGEAVVRVERHREELLRVAQAELARAGAPYPARLEVRPAGGRTAVRLVLGAGEGHNWFCLLYPPVCLSAWEEARAAAGETPPEVRSALAEWLRAARQRLAARGLLALFPAAP